MRLLTYAPDAWKFLDGFFCIYKPANLHCLEIMKTLSFNICRDLNLMEKRPTSKLVQLKGSVATGKPFEVEFVQNFADNELVVGPRYQEYDVRLKWITFLGKYTSGVLVLAINDGCKTLKNIKQSSLLRTYEVKGQFGLLSSNFMSDGKIREKSTYRHICPNALERCLASIQASHQSLAFEYSGVPLDSQEAYELASKGIVRPAGPSNPIIYSIKCTELKLPQFTLEIRCINEKEDYLAKLVHDIGIRLKSSAICTQLRQTQYGHFNLDHALLRKHWTLENILTNITLCSKIMESDNTASSAHFQQVKKSELSKFVESIQEEARKEQL